MSEEINPFSIVQHKEPTIGDDELNENQLNIINGMVFGIGQSHSMSSSSGDDEGKVILIL